MEALWATAPETCVSPGGSGTIDYTFHGFTTTSPG
jgi:hypothetical protein